MFSYDEQLKLTLTLLFLLCYEWKALKENDAEMMQRSEKKMKVSDLHDMFKNPNILEFLFMALA